MVPLPTGLQLQALGRQGPRLAPSERQERPRMASWRIRMKILALTVVAALSLLLSAGTSQAQFVDIRVGDEAPGFSLAGTDGRIHRLSDYRGKAVALFWFSHNLQYFLQKAECNSLVSAEKYIRVYDVVYFMVSVESPQANKTFADADCGNIPVLADTTAQTAKSYGVLKTIVSIGAPPPYADMWMFIIGSDGKILYIEPYEKVRAHLQTFGRDFAERLGQLGVAKAAVRLHDGFAVGSVVAAASRTSYLPAHPHSQAVRQLRYRRSRASGLEAEPILRDRAKYLGTSRRKAGESQAVSRARSRPAVSCSRDRSSAISPRPR